MCKQKTIIISFYISASELYFKHMIYNTHKWKSKYV